MDTAHRLLLKVAEETLRFEYVTGEVTKVADPHDTGWRCFPCLVSASISYKATLQTEECSTWIKPGETICVKPWVRHRAYVPKGVRGISRWSHVHFWIFEGISVFRLIDPPLVVSGPRSRLLGQIHAKLAALHQLPECSFAQLLRIRSLAADFLVLLAEVSEVRPESVELLQKAQRLAPVLSYLKENLGGDLGRKQLAKLAGLSPTRFDVLFRAALGVSPGLYVQGLRFQAAKRWLATSDLTVDEVGQRVGYPDPFHFSKIFKKQSGLSPSSFRDQARRGIAQMI